MSWARYDDNLPMNKKWVGKLRPNGVNGAAALGLHLLANTYCRHNGTAGVVEPHVPEALVGRCGPKLAALLVEAGMFDVREEGGWTIHDYAEFHDPNDPNPDRSAAERQREVAEKRAEAGRRGGLAKASKKVAGYDFATWQTPSKSLANPSPEPEPEPTVTSSSHTYPPTECPDGGGELVDKARLDAVVAAYALQALAQANAKGQVRSPSSYATKAAATAREHPDLHRLSGLFPTAPPDVIAAALHGEKHSLGSYPRADEMAPVIDLQARLG